MVQDGNLYGVSSQGTNMHATKAETRPTGSLPHQPNPGCYVGLWNIEKSGRKIRCKATSLSEASACPGRRSFFARSALSLVFVLIVLLGTNSGWPGGPADQWRNKEGPPGTLPPDRPCNAHSNPAGFAPTQAVFVNFCTWILKDRGTCPVITA